MELRHLEIFCKIIECGGFSKAAAALNLTQPTVSIHIKALEDELATRLLDRFGRSVRLTSAGEVLYRYAKSIVKLKGEAQLALDQFSGMMRGTLSVGASTIPGEYIIPPLLSGFKAVYPEIRPCLRIGDTKSTYGLVLNSEVDMGIVGSFINDRNIIIKELMEDELILIAPKDFGKSVLTKKEFKSVPLIQREAGSGSRASIEEFLRNSGLESEGLNLAAEVGSSQALIQSVRCAMGLAFISRVAVDDLIKGGVLKEVRVAGLHIKRHFYTITHKMRSNSPVCNAFLEFLEKSLK